MPPRPPIPPPPHRGGCLCGRVRYALGAAPLAINACHCDDCKKLSGVGHTVSLPVRRADFGFTGEVARFRKTADSGRQSDIVRCAACGTRLWHEPLALPEQLFLSAGTLDDPSWAIPASHIWVQKASADAVMRADALRIEGQPEDRRPLAEAFRALYGRSE